MSTDFATYKEYLKRTLRWEKCLDKIDAEEAIDELANTGNYQSDAQRNGVSQPLITQRKSSNKCKVIVPRGDQLCIGDWVYVLGENWLCMELYIDEYGVTYGELWMCNHQFKYQNFDKEIIQKWGIIDDGTYSNVMDKSINVTDNSFKCYISRDEQTNCLFVDKRLAIDILYDKNGKPILEVGKITVLDTKTGNYGDGSHLLTFKMKHDVYAPEVDSLAEMLCDYITPTEGRTEEETPKQSHFTIDGKTSLAIGSRRTYKIVFDTPNDDDDLVNRIAWEVKDNTRISLTPNSYECLVEIPLSEDLIGSTFTLACYDGQDDTVRSEYTVEVVAIG